MQNVVDRQATCKHMPFVHQAVVLVRLPGPIPLSVQNPRHYLAAFVRQS